jgi:hypothetical protein
MKSILAWMVNSTYFKKNSAIIGAFAAGWWFAGHYWQQLRATREAWGLEKGDFENILLAIIAATGILGSYALSMAKTHKEKKDGTEP